MTDNDTEYVALGPKAWGKAQQETEAVQNMLPNLPSRVLEGDDTVNIQVVRVRGFQRIHAVNGTVRADEILNERTVAMDTGKVREVLDLLTDLEIAVEELVYE